MCRVQIYIGMTSYQTQCSWAQVRAESMYMWVGELPDSTSLRLSYTLRPNRYGFDKLSDPTSSGSAPSRTHVHVGLTSYQTQCPRAHLWAEAKYMWVWRAVRPNAIRLDYALILGIYGSDELWDPTFLGSAPKNTWVWGTAKPNISGPNIMPISYGYRTNNLYRSHIGLQDCICLLLWLLT
jgi:hypothetical protein